jgi:hypothetical protein
MSQGGYTQTILLDANRLSSEEYSASNLADSDTAIFTNKVSNGITIDIGDQVSIQSAHIAQRGAGGSVIQMDGKVLGKKTITYTKTTNVNYIGYKEIIPPGGVFLEEKHSPTGYAYETSENVEEEVDMKDNEATVVFEYYKTTNGENNITLPRNFGMDYNADSDHSGQPDFTSSHTTSASYWNASDNYGIGLNTYYQSASHTFRPDFFEDETAIQATNACNADCLARKLKQDNSKYTLFKMDRIVWSNHLTSSASKSDYFQPHGTSVKPDPAICGYNRYREKVKLSVESGYNAPSVISTNITNELLKTEEPYVTISSSGSIIVNSTAYKAFPASNSFLYNAGNAINYFNASDIDGLPVGVGSQSVNNEYSVYYLNNYAYVGFKRPDFVEAGRAFTAYHGNQIAGSIPLSSSGTAIIYTNLTYSDEVLQKMKRFLDSQIIYPELLDEATNASNDNSNYSSYNTTSASLNASFREEARFIHCQVSSSNLGSIAPLGDDLYNVSYSTYSLQPPSQHADISSVPLFFYFNKNCSNLTASETIGDTNDNLAYGFARRWKSGSTYMIALITEPIGGIPSSYFGHQGGKLDTGTKIGYDYHFNAYGNSALILSSGYNGVQYYGHQQYTRNSQIREVYLGANNILFNFDSTESRFELSNLHSAEKVGNFYNAGDPNPASGVLAPPASSQAGADCYKINKPLRYDTWTPTMQPYPVIDVTGSFTEGTQNSFINMNTNLLQSTIYDAHGGIAIMDMGITEDKWTESIWGLLGFEYGQFNASGDNIKNLNNRFTNDNPNSSGITTNALITSQNSLQFSVNVFGTNLFNPNVNDDVAYHNTTQNTNPPPINTADFVVPPAIVITGDDLSTKIVANKLPRKILKGYFLINSDILDTANYYQLSNPLQTMAVVGKYNGANDFISYDGGGAVFTATRKKTITSIKTQILDPEGGTANVGDNSGVIYRIDKTISTDLNFAENLFKGVYSKK